MLAGRRDGRRACAVVTKKKICGGICRTDLRMSCTTTCLKYVEAPTHNRMDRWIYV